MAAYLPSQVWDLQNLTGPQCWVLSVICDYAGKNFKCWAAKETIARKAHLSVRTTYRAISDLIDLGYIRPCEGPEWTTTTTYLVNTLRIQRESADVRAQIEEEKVARRKARGVRYVQVPDEVPWNDPVREADHATDDNGHMSERQKTHVTVADRTLTQNSQKELLEESRSDSSNQTPVMAENCDSPQELQREVSPRVEKENLDRIGVKPRADVQKLGSIPAAMMLSIYHTECDSLPSVTVLSKARHAKMRARFKDMGYSLDAWTEYCKRIEASDHLTGRAERKGEWAGWTADFDFLIGPENYLKITEGKYDNRRSHEPRRDETLDESMARAREKYRNVR